jgi:hypothetical protein
MSRQKVLSGSLVNFLAGLTKKTIALLFWRNGAVRQAEKGKSLVPSRLKGGQERLRSGAGVAKLSQPVGDAAPRKSRRPVSQDWRDNEHWIMAKLRYITTQL